MRVVCFLPKGIVGGVEHRVIRYARKFVEAGIQVVLLLLEARETERAQTLPLSLFHGEVVIFKYSLLENQYCVTKRLAKKIQEQKIDIAWINGQIKALQATTLLRKEGVRVVMHVSGDSPYYHNLIYSFSPIIDLLVVFNKNLKMTCSKLGHRTVPVEFIAPGIELPLENWKPKIVNGNIELMYLGKIGGAIKKVERIIPFLEHLGKKNVDYRLQLIGDGDRRLELQENAEELGVKEKIVFWGEKSRSEAQLILATGDIILLFSVSEGCPNAVLEGMSWGLVPVVNQAAWVDTIVRHGENGYVFKDGNMSEAATYVSFLYHNKEKLKSASCNAFETVRKQFNLQSSVERYIRAFDLVMRSDRKIEENASIPITYSRLDHKLIPNKLTIGIRKLLKRLAAYR
jgi:glycosyltransferase involved in cell wall biosynthesis